MTKKFSKTDVLASRLHRHKIKSVMCKNQSSNVVLIYFSVLIVHAE